MAARAIATAAAATHFGGAAGRRVGMVLRSIGAYFGTTSFSSVFTMKRRKFEYVAFVVVSSFPFA